MTYAIGYFILGWDLTGKSPNKLGITDDEYGDLQDLEVIESFYQGGGGDEPAFIGICVDQIDECDNMGQKKLFNLFNEIIAEAQPTSKTMLELVNHVGKIANDPDTPQGLIDYLGKHPPEMFIAWGSS